MLFATLDPTLRQVRLPGGRPAILSDTVGFISDLPHELVEAFRATLEEVREADVILHVRDIAGRRHRGPGDGRGDGAGADRRRARRPARAHPGGLEQDRPAGAEARARPVATGASAPNARRTIRAAPSVTVRAHPAAPGAVRTAAFALAAGSRRLNADLRHVLGPCTSRRHAPRGREGVWPDDAERR